MTKEQAIILKNICDELSELRSMRTHSFPMTTRITPESNGTSYNVHVTTAHDVMKAIITLISDLTISTYTRIEGDEITIR